MQELQCHCPGQIIVYNDETHFDPGSMSDCHWHYRPRSSEVNLLAKGHRSRSKVNLQ